MPLAKTLTDSLPDRAAWLFSVRTFATAIIALYICFAFGQDRPYWAMASVYIASQPLSGATRSKAIYRLLGTILGATGAVVMVPNLVNAPLLLTLALSIWTGACLYLALLDRTPRSYVFMLAAYTAGIIGFPAVTEPGAVFTTAVARVQEIGIGIVCASVMASTIFPRRVQPALAAQLGQWLASARRWSLDILSGRKEDAATRRERQALAADIAQIDLLASYLAWDPTSQPDALRTLRALRRRILMLLPELSALADRVAALREANALAPVEPLLADAAAFIGDQSQDRAPPALRDACQTRIDPRIDPAAAWNDLLRASLLDRLQASVDLVEDCRRLHRHLAEDAPFPDVLAYHRTQGVPPVYAVDHARALWSALAAGVAVCLLCAFWIMSAWSAGAGAATLATVVCCVFAAQDDPVPAILKFLLCATISIAVDAIYLFVLLPPLSDFVMLTLALAPAFLVYGLIAGTPKTATLGLPLAAVGATLLALQPTYDAQFDSFLNSAIGAILGMGLAAIITAVIRSVGAEQSAARMIRQGWSDLAAAAAHHGERDRARFAALMLDRIGLLAPRMAILAPENGLGALDLLAELRAGLNVIMLRKARRTLPPETRSAVEATLSAIARHFGRRAHGQQGLPDGELAAPIDAALAQAARTGNTRTLIALVGLRRALLPDTPPAKA